jgi:inosine-uridine nucleoside N-ribohydrolase
MKRVIIDTDPGIDDAAAILLALASPELAIEALTTVYGNGTIAATTQNALEILEIAGRPDIPVYQGAGKPLLREPHIAHHVHGHDALGDVGDPGANRQYSTWSRRQ